MTVDNNDSWQESYSATYSHVLSERTKLSLNYNRTSYNHEQELASKPGKNQTTEKIIGVTFKNVATKNLSVKLEEHFVSGVSWLTTEQNPNGFHQKWKMFVAQVIYEF